MGHSNMTVSLGYLRHLDLPALTMAPVAETRGTPLAEVIGLRVRILCVKSELDEALNHTSHHGNHPDRDSPTDALQS